MSSDSMATAIDDAFCEIRSLRNEIWRCRKLLNYLRPETVEKRLQTPDRLRRTVGGHVSLGSETMTCGRAYDSVCHRGVAWSSYFISNARYRDAAQGIAERQMFELVLNRTSRYWKWHVCNSSGKILMVGRERSRAAARYHAQRALFLLLLTTCPQLD